MVSLRGNFSDGALGEAVDAMDSAVLWSLAVSEGPWAVPVSF